MLALLADLMISEPPLLISFKQDGDHELARCVEQDDEKGEEETKEKDKTNLCMNVGND